MIVPVPQDFLRALFNALDVEDEVKEHKLTKHSVSGTKRVRHLHVGSRSRMSEYRLLNGRTFAKTHQYQDRDGSLVGKPDPKYLLYGRLVFVLEHD